MNWLKNLLQRWLEVKVQHQCEHQWEILKTVQVEELYQMPDIVLRSGMRIHNIDSKTYKIPKTKYIMTCKKCGDLKAEIL